MGDGGDGGDGGGNALVARVIEIDHPRDISIMIPKYK